MASIPGMTPYLGYTAAGHAGVTKGALLPYVGTQVASYHPVSSGAFGSVLAGLHGLAGPKTSTDTYGQGAAQPGGTALPTAPPPAPALPTQAAAPAQSNAQNPGETVDNSKGSYWDKIIAADPTYMQDTANQAANYEPAIQNILSTIKAYQDAHVFQNQVDLLRNQASHGESVGYANLGSRGFGSSGASRYLGQQAEDNYGRGVAAADMAAGGNTWAKLQQNSADNQNVAYQRLLQGLYEQAYARAQGKQAPAGGGGPGETKPSPASAGAAPAIGYAGTSPSGTHAGGTPSPAITAADIGYGETPHGAPENPALGSGAKPSAPAQLGAGIAPHGTTENPTLGGGAKAPAPAPTPTKTWSGYYKSGGKIYYQNAQGNTAEVAASKVPKTATVYASKPR